MGGLKENVKMKFCMAVRIWTSPLSLMSFSIDIKFCSRDLSLYHALLDADRYISVEEGNLKLITVPVFQNVQFF